ncbi:MAG: Mur ligase family protein [Candidatus Saccharimonadales bacterium]
MKQSLKKIVVSILGRQVRQLRRKHTFKIIGVAGGTGKTSTKLAIAQALSKSQRVRYQEGNYNDIVSVPLIFFGASMPGLLNPIAWAKIFLGNAKQIYGSYPYDIVVAELGTDGPGQIAAFNKYLELDMAVVTAIVPEHMEYFDDLQAVADEELSVASYSKQVLYNADLVDAAYIKQLPDGSVSYALKDKGASYYVANLYHSAGGFEGDIKHNDAILLHFTHEVVAETQLYSALAAAAVGNELGLKHTDILTGIANIKPVAGRLRRLRGINGSTIIDDTYNANPEAVKAALQALQKIDAPQRIALLGNMNELGNMSAAAHKEIGAACDPSWLHLVVTIGPDAGAHLAPAASSNGCTVKTFDNPYDAGEYLQAKIRAGAVILAKGSQNKVFAEEAVKLILADPEDTAKLVRQSPYWLKRKANNFKRK